MAFDIVTWYSGDELPKPTCYSEGKPVYDYTVLKLWQSPMGIRYLIGMPANPDKDICEQRRASSERYLVHLKGPSLGNVLRYAKQERDGQMVAG